MNDTGELLSWIFKLSTIASFITTIAALNLLLRFWTVTLSGDKVCRYIGRHPLTPLFLAGTNFAAMIASFSYKRIALAISKISDLDMHTLLVETNWVICAIQIIIFWISLIYMFNCEWEIYKTIPADDPASWVSIDNLHGVRRKNGSKGEQE